MKTTNSCCKVLSAVSAMAAACIAFGEINVMASRSYVDKKTSVSVVTNDNVEGYRIGSNTNFTFATHSSLTGLSNSIPGMIQEMAPAPGNYQVVSNAAMNARSMTDFSVETNGWVMVWPEGTNSWMSPYQPGMWISGEAILQFDYEWWLNVPGMMYPIMSDSPSDAKELTFTTTGASPKTYRLYRGNRLALSSEIVQPDYSASNQTLVDTITHTAPAPGNYQAVSNAAMSVSATNDYLRLDGNSDMTGPITFTGEGVISGGSSGVTIYAFGSTWYFNEWMPERVARYSDITSSGFASETYVDTAIDRLAAYYITANENGDAFPTLHSLTNAAAYWSGGEARTPTRNDYAVVLADESHGNAEWRYIYAVAADGVTGKWEAQYPIETNDYDALSNRPQINGVTLGGTNNTARGLGLIGTEGGIVAGPLSIEMPADPNRGLSFQKIGLVPLDAGYWRMGQGSAGFVISLKDGTWRECSLWLSNDGKTYINTAAGYVQVPDVANGGVLAVVSQIPTDNSQLENGAGYITAAAIAGKQDALTPAQTNAVNSGVTAEKVSTWDGYAAQINGKLDKSDVSSAINGTVTPAYIRERLGVSLYVGEDGGIYIRTEGE